MISDSYELDRDNVLVSAQHRESASSSSSVRVSNAREEQYRSLQRRAMWAPASSAAPRNVSATKKGKKIVS